MRAWKVFGIEDVAIIVFATNENAAITFCDKKNILEFESISELKVKRMESFDKYASTFKDEKYIDWNTAKGQRAYWEQNWKLNDARVCYFCDNSEFPDVPESTVFNIGDYEVNQLCFDCILNEDFKVTPSQEEHFENIKKQIKE